MAGLLNQSFSTKKTTRLVCRSFIIFILVGIGVNISIAVTADAAPVTGFKAGRIIDDTVFTNKGSMSALQIQTFLNSKVSVCDTGGTQLSEMNNANVPDYNGNGSIQRWEWGKAKYNQTSFPCLKDYKVDNISAAQIIYDTAQEFSINPQVLIVLLQKEQGLVTDTWPLNIQYRSATGYGCPDTAACDSQYYGLKNQIRWAATMFRAIMNNSPTWYTPYLLGDNYIRYNPNSSCGGSVVNIENRSTQALYNYTPYQPNQGALDAGWGTANCGAYGNRNFFLYFTDWFNSTLGTVHNNVDYKPVFDATYYLNRYPDLKAALNTTNAFDHFIRYGIGEGRQASENFNVISYKNRYPDLRMAFRGNMQSYFIHYITAGQKEGRIATGVVPFTPVTAFKGVNYASVYDFSSYINRFTDLKNVFAGDDFGAIEHFVQHGLKEGRQASDAFNVRSYSNNNPDLRTAFGNDLRAYYLHYINNGKQEGRIATGDTYVGITRKGSVDYAAVYNFTEYFTRNADLASTFGSKNDTAALDHFINFGMREGRSASTTFNVNIYRNNYADLRTAYGNDLIFYHLHYIDYGKKEGRVAI